MKRHIPILLLALIGCSEDGGPRTVTFTGGPTPLTFAAVQDGNGPWGVVTPSAAGTYAFTPSTETYGIVAVCGDAAFATIEIVQATVAETTSPNFRCSIFSRTLGTIHGTVTGSGLHTSLHVANYMHLWGDGSFTAEAPTGQWDVFALRRLGPLEPIAGDLVVRKNGVTIKEDAPASLAFDFKTEAFSLELHSATFEGALPDELTEVRTDLRVKPGSTFLRLGPHREGSFHSLPAVNLRADDIHIITATASSRDGTASRQVRRWQVAAENFTAAFPPALPDARVESESPTPYLLMRGTIPSDVDADRYDFIYEQPRGSQSYVWWTAGLTRGYAATGATAYTLPDLSALPGFAPSWGLTPGMEVLWQVVATSSDAGPGDLLDADQSADQLDGRRHEISQRKGRFPR